MKFITFPIDLHAKPAVLIILGKSEISELLVYLNGMAT